MYPRNSHANNIMLIEYFLVVVNSLQQMSNVCAIELTPHMCVEVGVCVCMNFIIQTNLKIMLTNFNHKSNNKKASRQFKDILRKYLILTNEKLFFYFFQFHQG